MAYGPFTATDYLGTATTPVTAVPITMACRFYSTDITVAQNLMTICRASTDVSYFQMTAGGSTAGDPITATTREGATTATAVTSTGYSANTWHSAVAVFASSTSRRAYIDGGSSGSNTTSATPTNPSRIGLGINNRLTVGAPLLGLLAQTTIWNVALTDADVAAYHAARGNPWKVRPNAIVFHDPLVRNLGDLKRGLVVTMTGTVAVAAHCPVMP